jgi:radical SAM protein with 4Fe4S-binding SPASM domain
MMQVEIYPGFQILDGIEHPKVSRPEYQEYRRRWELNPVEFKIGRFPLHLDIDVTTACNLRCPMCPRTLIIEHSMKWKNEFFPLELYKSIIDEGVSYGLCAVNLNYLGEPLLHPDIVEMVQYASKRGVIDIMFHTNATLLTPAISEKLIDAGLDKLHLSLDSANPKRYERMRVGAKFDRVVENIKQFMEIRRKKGMRLPIVRAQMVLTKENSDEVENFKSFWLDIVDSVGVREYRNPGQLDKVDRYPDSRRKGYSEFVCPELWRRLVITVDGVVLPCCRDEGRDMIVGNVYNSSICAIWTGERMQSLRRIHRQRKAAKIKGCNKCDYLGGEK